MTARTTVRLPENLMREVKKLAAETDRTLTAVIEDALRETLERRLKKRPAPTRLPTDGEGGLRPGVDLDDRRALQEILDQGTPMDALD